MKKLFLFILVIISANLFAIECDYEYHCLYNNTDFDGHGEIMINYDYVVIAYQDSVTNLCEIVVYHLRDDIESFYRLYSYTFPRDVYDICLGENFLYTIEEGESSEKQLSAYSIDETSLNLQIIGEDYDTTFNTIKSTKGLSVDNLYLFDKPITTKCRDIFVDPSYTYLEAGRFAFLDDSIEIEKFKNYGWRWTLVGDSTLVVLIDNGVFSRCALYDRLRINGLVDACITEHESLFVLKENCIVQYDIIYTEWIFDMVFFTFEESESLMIDHHYKQIEVFDNKIVLINDDVCEIYSYTGSLSSMEMITSIEVAEELDLIEVKYNKIYYYSHETGLHIIDVADSSFLHSTYKPVIMSGKIKQLQSYSNRVVVRNDKDILYSCDFSDPSRMTCDDYIKIPSVNDYDIFEDDLIASSDSGLFHYDIDADGSLILRDSFSHDYQNVCFNESGVFATSLDDRSIHFMELNIYSRIEEISHFSYDGNITTLHLTEDKLYTITDDSILIAYNITDIECPLLIGEFVHNPIHRIKTIGNYAFVVDTTNYNPMENFGSTFMINGESCECIDTLQRISDVLIKDSFVCLLHNVGRTPLRGEFITLRYDGISEFDTLYTSDLPNYYDKVCATEAGMVGQYYFWGIYADYDHMNASLGFSYINDLFSEPSEIVIYRGWNAVSYPYSPDKTIANACLGINILSAFEFENGTSLYRNSDTLTAGTGYWFLCDSTYEPAQLYGRFPVDSLTLELYTGWNLVGGVFHTIAVSELDTDGIIMPIFEHNPLTGSYEEATVIEPFKAYWIFTDRDMELELR